MLKSRIGILTLALLVGVASSLGGTALYACGFDDHGATSLDAGKSLVSASLDGELLAQASGGSEAKSGACCSTGPGCCKKAKGSKHKHDHAGHAHDHAGHSHDKGSAAKSGACCGTGGTCCKGSKSKDGSSAKSGACCGTGGSCCKAKDGSAAKSGACCGKCQKGKDGSSAKSCGPGCTKACCAGKSGCSAKSCGANCSKADCAKKGCSKEGCAKKGCASKAGSGAKSCSSACTKSCCAAAAAKGLYSVGSTVKDFSLPNASSGEEVALSKLAGSKGTVLIFWNQNCPYVVDVDKRVSAFHNAYASKGINVVAIDSGVNNPDAEIKTYAAKKPFPVLINKDSTVAALFGASKTPEVFFLDNNMKVQYHGAFDSGTVKDKNATPTAYVQAVSDAYLAGQELPHTEVKAFGCSVKYAPGVKEMMDAAGSAAKGSSSK